LKSREVFLASFTHELRNSLNSLNGNVSLAVLENQDNRISEYLKNAQICGEILQQLINNILDSAKADYGKIEISNRRTTVPEMMNKVWIITKELIRKKGLSGHIFISEKTPSTLMLDSYRIIQVLLNLITNAIKFTDEGGISIRVKWFDKAKMGEETFGPSPYSDEDEGVFQKDENIDWIKAKRKDYSNCDKNNLFDPLNKISVQDHFGKGVLQIMVRDTGTGIPSKALPFLFSKYYQAGGLENRQKGTGLGLWISKNIIQSMKGDIRVYSKEKVGTTFIICLETEIPH